MENANALLTAVTNGVASVIGWVGDVITAMFSGDLVNLLPLFAIGISISVVLLGVKIIKRVVWGA